LEWSGEKSFPTDWKLPPRIKYQPAVRAKAVITSIKGQQSIGSTTATPKINQDKKVTIPSSQQTKRKFEIESKKTKVSEIDDIFASSKKKEVTPPTSKQVPIEPNLQIESTYGIIKSANVQIFSPEAPLERIDKATGLSLQSSSFEGW
jgi:adenylate kinase